MTEILEAEASLKTVSVTIQALIVSGKQMTLAVFRQLPEGAETTASQLWGVVRYAIKDDGDVWLVYSEAGRLWRRSVGINERYGPRALYDMAEKQMLRSIRSGGLCPSKADAQAELDRTRPALMTEITRAKADKALVESLPQLFIAV